MDNQSDVTLESANQNARNPVPEFPTVLNMLSHSPVTNKAGPLAHVFIGWQYLTIYRWQITENFAREFHPIPLVKNPL